LLFTAQSLRATQSQIGLSEQGQLADRFGKAIEQLGSDKVDIRLGGIYALERLALDSTRDHPTVMEVLTAYVRHSAPRLTCSQLESGDLSQLQLDVHATVQAAISVIRRRNIAFDTRILDLANTCLRGADLSGANLFVADLSGADLTDVRGYPR
jgi:uncharacterized protein YjbI with pentapeptide repeats